jgi:hypothetical protein
MALFQEGQCSYFVLMKSTAIIPLRHAHKRETHQTQFGFAASAAAGAFAGVSAASGAAGFAPAPVNRSSTERTASRVLRSFFGIEQRRRGRRAADQAFGIGKIRGSSHGPCATNSRSKPGAAFGAETRLAMPLRSYSRCGTEAVPVSVRRAAGHGGLRFADSPYVLCSARHRSGSNSIIHSNEGLQPRHAHRFRFKVSGRTNV